VSRCNRGKGNENTNSLLSCLGTPTNRSCVASITKGSTKKSRSIRHCRPETPRNDDGIDCIINDLITPLISWTGSTRVSPETYGASCGYGSSSMRCSLQENVRHASSYAFISSSRLAGVIALGGPSHNPRAASARTYFKSGV
jgi:hypothetical protein